MNPLTIAGVAEKTLAGESFAFSLKNFLDDFYTHPSLQALLTEPPLLAPGNLKDGSVQDAYLAATAEQLARQAGLPCPRWAFGNSRALSRPWFALNSASLRALLLWESPPSFRSRNLFVSENALSRA